MNEAAFFVFTPHLSRSIRSRPEKIFFESFKNVGISEGYSRIKYKIFIFIFNNIYAKDKKFGVAGKE